MPYTDQITDIAHYVRTFFLGLPFNINIYGLIHTLLRMQVIRDIDETIEAEQRMLEQQRTNQASGHSVERRIA